MNIVFLDINGVLDTNEKMDEINSDNLNRLKHIVDTTNSKIVISSSLKNSYYYTGHLSKHLLKIINEIKDAGIEIIGITPKCNSRVYEIMTYLREHPEIENYCILDEVEAALDEVNVDAFGKYICKLKEKTQFIVITHKKKTMEFVDVLYGITMQESGVSKLVSVKLEEIK